MNHKVHFFFTLSAAQAVVSRRFDSGLGGLALNEYIILSMLGGHAQGKMRRTDLAQALGLTQSAITRILAPMEKVGLIRRESDKNDARVSFVSIAPGGRRKRQEAEERAELLAGELLPDMDDRQVEKISQILARLAGTTVSR